MAEGKLYRVLKTGIRQRSSEGGWSAPNVGDVIKVSDVAAPSMIADGWIEPFKGLGGEEAQPAPEGRSARKRKWLAQQAAEAVPSAAPADGVKPDDPDGRAM